VGVDDVGAGAGVVAVSFGSLGDGGEGLPGDGEGGFQVITAVIPGRIERGQRW
jgi:hypothetical protein